MTNPSTPTIVLARLAILGGAAWLAKLAVIAGTGGETTDTGAAAAFYLAGVVLLVIGSAAIGARLTEGRHPALRVGAGLVSPVLFFASVAITDAIGRALVSGSGPAWFEDEAGIGLAAVLWLTIGVAIASRRSAAHTGAGSA